MGSGRSGLRRRRGNLSQGRDPAYRADSDRDRQRPFSRLPGDRRAACHRRRATGTGQCHSCGIRLGRVGTRIDGGGPDARRSGHLALDPERRDRRDRRDYRKPRATRDGGRRLLGRNAERDDPVRLAQSHPRAWVTCRASGRRGGEMRTAGPSSQRRQASTTPSPGRPPADQSACRCRPRRTGQDTRGSRPGPEDRNRGAAERGCHPEGAGPGGVDDVTAQATIRAGSVRSSGLVGSPIAGCLQAAVRVTAVNAP